MDHDISESLNFARSGSFESMMPPQTTLTSKVIERASYDHTTSSDCESYDSTAMDLCIAADHESAQNVPKVNATTMPKPKEVVPASSTSEVSTASTSSEENMTIGTSGENGIAIKKRKCFTTSSIAKRLSEKLDAEGQDDLQILVDRAENNKRSSHKIDHKPEAHPRDSDALQKLLRENRPEKAVYMVEEDEHPWGATPASLQSFTGPLMRAWDGSSQSKIEDEEQGFLAVASDAPLDNEERRRTALTKHAKWGCRDPSPFISTTNSIKEISRRRIPQLKARHKRRRGRFNGKLSLINPNQRLQCGLTMLSMQKELNYYKAPQSAYDSFYADELLMLYQIPPREIIRTYLWRDIEDTLKSDGISIEQWYERYAMEDFRLHERDRLAGKESHSIGICSPGECIGGVRAHIGTVGKGKKRKSETREDSDDARKCPRVEALEGETLA